MVCLQKIRAFVNLIFYFLFQILDLSCCKGLNFESVLYVVTECSELIELNLQNTRLCQNSTDILRWVNLRRYFHSLTSNYLFQKLDPELSLGFQILGLWGDSNRLSFSHSFPFSKPPKKHSNNGSESGLYNPLVTS